jgi:hypothetical protein
VAQLMLAGRLPVSEMRSSAAALATDGRLPAATLFGLLTLLLMGP